MGHRDKNNDPLDTSRLLRMPWTNSDNAFSWVEITRRCNLTCSYCYQTNDPLSDKSISEVENEVKTILRLRKCDTMFISGGEPLLHADLEEIVKMIRSFNVKAVLVTNGHTLNKEKVRTLKEAGLFGFIIHVDKGQRRPGWTDRSEEELNSLRQTYADMISSEGGLICGFNTTVLPETLHEVPDIVRWTIKNIHTVCTNTFIPVRFPSEDDPWDLYVRGEKISFKDTVFSTKTYKNPTKKILTAVDIYKQVQRVLPSFRGNAFLGGTEITDAPKWLFANIIGNEHTVFGNMGSKAMEIIQNGYHLFTGRFLSFLKPASYGTGRLMFALGIIDKELRKTLFAYFGDVIRNPLHLFKKVSIQSLLILQPQDVLPSGKQDLCDGCPNKTYLDDGRLVSMCRKEEYIRFGDMITLKKKEVEDETIYSEKVSA